MTWPESRLFAVSLRSTRIGPGILIVPQFHIEEQSAARTLSTGMLAHLPSRIEDRGTRNAHSRGVGSLGVSRQIIAACDQEGERGSTLFSRHHFPL